MESALITPSAHRPRQGRARMPPGARRPPAPPSAGGLRAERLERAAGLDAATVTAAIARGDRAAFGEFYEAWFDRCYAMARGMSGRDESACLDIVQEAMLRVVRRMRPLPDAAALEAWMRRVVRSAAVDSL